VQFKSVLAAQNISFSKEVSLASEFLVEKGKSNEPLFSNTQTEHQDGGTECVSLLAQGIVIGIR